MATRHYPKLSKAEQVAKAKGEPMFVYLRRTSVNTGSKAPVRLPPDWGTSTVGRILCIERDMFGRIIRQY